MATLGSTSDPTYGDGHWQVPSAVAAALTLPAGGPWRITGIGMWFNGNSGWDVPPFYLNLWNSSGNSLAHVTPSGSVTAAAYPGGSTSHFGAVSVGPINGGTTVKVGYAFANSGTRGLQASLNSGGTRYYATVSSSVPSGVSWSSATGAPGVWLTYELANSLPNAPTLNTPDGQGSNVLYPDINFTPSDPDGDTHTQYRYQIATDTGFTSLNEDSTVSGSFANGVAINRTVVNPCSRGQNYYWRAMTNDGSGWGPWSGYRRFYIAVAPTTAMTVPTAGQTARLYYDAGSNTTPKFDLGWSYGDTDGHAQDAVQISIYNDSSGSQGSLAYQTTPSQSSQSVRLPGFAPTNGAYYWITVQVRCSFGVWSAVSTAIRTRVRWGRASYYVDIGATPPVSWQAPGVTSSIPGSSALVMEYAAASSAGGASEPATWYDDQGSVPIPGAAAHVYLWHRVTMFAWGSATPASPSLSDVTLRWNASASQLDIWQFSGGVSWSIDEGTKVYGSQSLKASGTGAGSGYAYQVVDVTPNTIYTLQGRLKTVGDSHGCVVVYEADGSAGIVQTSYVTATSDWTRYAVQFNSGGRTQVQVRCYAIGTAGTIAWFDAVKLEASSIVTPWSPGYVGAAAVVDAGGIQIDGRGGGIFRLQGSNGAARDLVELGAKGLQFGGDSTATIDSPATGVIAISNIWAGSVSPSGGLFSQRASAVLDAIQTFVGGDAAARLAINANGDMQWGGGGGAADVGLFRPSAGLIRVTGALTADSMASGAFSNGGSTSSVVVTTAGTYYFMTNNEVSFTPAYAGQKFRFVYTAHPQAGSAITDYVLFQVRITDASNNQIGSTVWYGRAQFAGATNAAAMVAVAGIWTSDAAAARKVRVYVTLGATNGATVYAGYGNLVVEPLLA